ncbi:hypothetical protein CBM2626_B140171 [Cupriavidus taiwanensis]|nr:hypothetical protein CBM2626_B140171 [Cupriavidus taiwanensis]
MEEVVIGLDVWSDDLQHIVCLTGGAVALHHCCAVTDGSFKRFDDGLIVGRKIYFCENAVVKANPLPIDGDRVPMDDPFLFHGLESLPTRRRRKADCLGDLLGRLTRVSLQLCKDSLRVTIKNRILLQNGLHVEQIVRF